MINDHSPEMRADQQELQRLAESEERYRTLFDSVDVGFCVIEILLDADGTPVDYRFLEYNPAFERHTGLVDGIGKTARELVPDLDEFWFRTYGGVALTGEPVRFESHAAAMERWFDVYALRVGAAEQHKVALLFTDITARKAAEETLQQSGERERSFLTEIFQQAPAFMAALRGPNHVFELANPPYYKITGQRELIGKTVAEALPEVVEQGFIDLLDRVYQTGEPFVGKDVSIWLQTSPEEPLEEHFLDFTYQPLFDREGAVTGVLAHGIDLTERKRKEQQVRATVDALTIAEERYRTLITSIDVGFCLIRMLYDADGVPYDYLFIETNPAFDGHTGLVNPVGKTIRELAPGIDTSWFRIYGDVARTGQPVRFENHDPALSRWFDAYAQRVGDAARGEVVILFTDITARRAAEEKLRDAQTRLTSALSAGNIATWTFDIVNNRLAPDANFAPLFGLPAEYGEGGSLDIYMPAIFPADQQRVTDAIAQAIAEDIPYEAEYRVVLPDGTLRWLSARGTVERDSTGKAISMPGVIVDITERIERERRDRFLDDVTVRARALLDPEEVLYETAKAIGEYTDAHRALYIEIDDSADRLTIRRDYVKPDAEIPSMAGTFPLSAFGPPIVANLRAGNITEVVDVETDERLTPENRETFRATNFRSFLAAPLHKAGQFVAVLALHYAQPRVWTPEEAELLSAVAERTWLAVENARLFRETQRRAEREALLNQISAATRGNLEPATILKSVVTLLGQGLDADRCYFVRYDQNRDTARVSPEWDRAGVEPITERTLQMSSFSVNSDAAYKAGHTHVVDDAIAYAPDAAAALQALNIRALLRVPIAIGDQMTALSIAMSTGPREWTEDEVRLVENVAALVRSTLESAYAQQRERNIARQLQGALQPPPPADLPGLALASFYRPALAEASVGGDFFDVFSVGPGCTALVVADLAGKGLAAAQQVAIVKNMLRFALYNGDTLVEAMTRLHETLVENDLLTGFATLFAGCYDHAKQDLTYVNCGQESGLVLRAATKRIEQLAPTGSVLGGFGPGGFEQQVITLHEGDVLALFTDGLTEVGPSRKEMLDGEGVSEILHRCCTGETVSDPHVVVEQMIAEVDAFARGGTPDDIALLVGVVRVV